SELIPVGSEVYILERNDEKLLSSMFKDEASEQNTSITEDDFFSDLFTEEKEDGGKHLNVILKSSSKGSLEAIEKSLSKLEREGYTVKIISSGVGDISLQ